MLIFVLVAFLGIPFAIVLATPARHLKFYLLWLAMLGLLAIVWPRGVDHSRFAGLEEALEAFLLGAWTFIVAGTLLGSAIITLAMAAIYLNARITTVVDQAETAAHGDPIASRSTRPPPVIGRQPQSLTSHRW